MAGSVEAMSSVIDRRGFTVCAPDDDDLGYPSWGIFDSETGDVLPGETFTYSRDADDRADQLEKIAYLTRWDGWGLRYSVDRIPADHPLAIEARA